MIYISITFAVIGAFLMLTSFNESMEEQKEKKLRKYEVPIEFWDDYNHILYLIQNLNNKNQSRVQYMIDDLIYKYADMLEYKVFLEKISDIIELFERKKKSLSLISQSQLN
jgi:hypothetical protein